MFAALKAAPAAVDAAVLAVPAAVEPRLEAVEPAPEPVERAFAQPSSTHHARSAISNESKEAN